MKSVIWKTSLVNGGWATRAVVLTVSVLWQILFGEIIANRFSLNRPSGFPEYDFEGTRPELKQDTTSVKRLIYPETYPERTPIGLDRRP
ncbi:MAG: hypothetical protein R2788_09075 [Saprospiraceae bacterium]